VAGELENASEHRRLSSRRCLWGSDERYRERAVCHIITISAEHT
jgi:hypothetical protein